MTGLYAAVNRITRSGMVLGSGGRISVWDALKAITINAAYQYHEEKNKGSLEIGKLDDLVILNRRLDLFDPFMDRQVVPERHLWHRLLAEQELLDGAF